MKILVLLFLFIRFWEVCYAADLPSCKNFWKALKSSERTWKSSENYGKYYQKLKRSGCEKEWTILVYMQADNNLTPYAYWDLYEMESAFKRQLNGSTLKTDVIVQVDTRDSQVVSRLHMFQSPRAYKQLSLQDVEKKTLDDFYSPIVQQIAENKLPKEQRQHFSDFLQWGMKRYPAKNTMVILWGHGQGWTASQAVQFGGIAIDDTQKTRLSIPDIRQGLSGHKIDVLATDACLMQTVEVIYELADVSDYIIGSSQIQNFLGFPYRRLLYEINSGGYLGLKKQYPRAASSYLVAKMLPQLFKQSFDTARGLQGRIDPSGIKQLTMSSFNTQEFKNYLIPELKKMSAVLLEYVLQNPFAKVAIKSLLQSMPRFLGGSRDLSTLIGRLEERLRLDFSNVQHAINRAVVGHAYGEDYLSFAIEGIAAHDDLYYYAEYFKALAIWQPISRKNFKRYRKNFLETRFYKETRWNLWTEQIYPGAL